MTPEKRREGERLAAQCASDLDNIATLVGAALRAYMLGPDRAGLFDLAAERFSAARKAACEQPGRPDLQAEAMLAGLTLVGLRYTTLEIARGLLAEVDSQ